MSELYLEDLAIGQVFESETLTVTAEAIKRFAREFDPQPFHLDEATAAASFFGGLAASGWHTASMSMRLLVQTMHIAGGLIGAGVDEITWPRPVRPGDVLRLIIEVIELRPSQSRPERGMAKIRVKTFNQADKPVQIMVCNVIVPRQV